MFHMVSSILALVTHYIEDVERAQGILGAGETSATHLECCCFFPDKSFHPCKFLSLEMSVT